MQSWVSLGGTHFNCAGGSTPWGSWITCEETVNGPDVGPDFLGQGGPAGALTQPHGYIFEVDPQNEGLSEPVPLTAMGRFEHEAAAVDPSTGIVYLTEDRHQSLLYRFIPNVPGKLREGGRLQALAIPEEDG